ncbi:PucR family transcriptional regulator [Marinicrinis lubricantis]|uniref:PucR family transcriptional regulator n=1 Tax=Marinicrinis lubricantis TaxID=2086470 RepID=A0ABW1IRX4_9BACL
MEGNDPIKLHELLSRPYFQDAEIIASQKALERPVKWVHIMEVAKVGQLLNGCELILSTGIGWHDEEETSLAFLRELIENDAAGLCIELGIYTERPSGRMTELALQHDFPLILFHKEVKYVDITRDLHTYFINRHHLMVTSLDQLTDEFNRILLSGKGLTSLLRLLHDKTKKQISFIPIDNTAIFIPPLPKEVQKNKLAHLQLLKSQDYGGNSKTCAVRPIDVMNQTCADLVMEGEHDLNEFDILALDRCATAVAQEWMRTMYLEERKRYKENGWVKEWLDGKLKESEIREFFPSHRPDASIGLFSVCVFEIDRKTLRSPEFETLLIQRMIVARSLFERIGIVIIPTLSQQHLIFVLAHLKEGNRWIEMVRRTIGKLQKTDKSGGTAIFSGIKGVGTAEAEMTQLHRSYVTALEAIHIQKTVGTLPTPFYNELHVYRLISSLEKSGQLYALVQDYLGSLLPYDREKNTQLLKTLKVYLQLSCAKQETAKELFIVRQTLYHRLNKISELMGDDFTSPEKRLMIELALFAYEYLYGPIT